MKMWLKLLRRNKRKYHISAQNMVPVVHDATTFQGNFYNLNYPASCYYILPSLLLTSGQVLLPSWPPWTFTVPNRHPTSQEPVKMDFVQQFLSLRPEEMFKTINREPPTTFLFGLITICGIVLTTTIIFIIGLCNLCKRDSSIKDSEESVTLVETPMETPVWNCDLPYQSKSAYSDTNQLEWFIDTPQ